MRVLRTTFVLVVLTLFLMLVGSLIGGRNGMTIGLGIAICTNAFAYFFSDKIALASSGAKPVTREQLPRLYAVMERLAAKANIPVPKLYVVPDQAPNAFRHGQKSAACVCGRDAGLAGIDERRGTGGCHCA